MANEKRLIDANALDAQFRETKMVEIFPHWKELSSETKSELIRFGKALKEKMQNAPTVDAVEVVHGYWIERPLDNFRKYEVKCSECGFVGISDYDQYLEPIDFYFCPRCGARMDRLDGDGNG